MVRMLRPSFWEIIKLVFPAMTRSRTSFSPLLSIANCRRTRSRCWRFCQLTESSLNRFLHEVAKFLGAEGLLQELDGPAFHGLHCHAHVGESR